MGDGHQRHQHGRHPLPPLPPAALWHQGVQDPHQGHHQRRHLFRRQRPCPPVRPEDHPERPRPSHQRRQQVLDDQALHGPSDQDDQQLPQASQDQQGQQQPPQQHRDGYPRPQRGSHLHRPREAGGVQPRQPPDDRVVNHRHRHGPGAQLTGEHQHRQRHQHHRRDQPAHPCRSQRTRQSWRLARGTPPSTRTRNPTRELDLVHNSPCWQVCGNAHDASQPRQRKANLDTRRRPRIEPLGVSVPTRRLGRWPEVGSSPPSRQRTPSSGAGRIRLSDLEGTTSPCSSRRAAPSIGPYRPASWLRSGRGSVSFSGPSASAAPSSSHTAAETMRRSGGSTLLR